MRERFKKTIFTNGKCSLEIRTPSDILQESAGHDLLPDGEFLEPSEITPKLLHMLAEAYHAGYKEAVEDGQNAVMRLMYENPAPRRPAPKVRETLDYPALGIGVTDSTDAKL